MKIIAISGFIGSGKDTVAEYLINNYGFERESLAKSLKDATASIFSWPRGMLEGNTSESRGWREETDEWWSERLNIKDFTPRLALQLLGTEVFRENFNSDIWIYSLESRLKETTSNIVITDCRFPNEISMIKRLGGYLVWVKRDNLPEWYDMALSVNTTNPELLNSFKEKYGIHDSEFKWIGSEFDYILENNFDLTHLNKSIDLMMKAFENN